MFPDLTVLENLKIGAWGAARPRAWCAAGLLAMFPLLAERSGAPAGALSGGEQQELAMCRSLLLQPSLLLVDEPTEGLAPAAVERVEALLRVVLDGGSAVLLVEQKLAVTLDLSDRVHVLGDGRIQFSGTPAAFRAGDAVRRLWLEA